MKRTGKWFFSKAVKLLAMIAIVLLIPFTFGIFRLIPDVTGEIEKHSVVLKQKLESSKRLEVTKVEEEGVFVEKTKVVILGTVGSTTIRYRYTASIGIDLEKVQMIADQDRIIFLLPKYEILNDGIEALEINRNDFFSRAIDRNIEDLLHDQLLKCREQLLNNEKAADQYRTDTVKAFHDTICTWLEGFGERHYDLEFHQKGDYPAD